MTCIDVNECQDESHNCSNNAKCRNTPGSHHCQCNVGYAGDGMTCTSK